MVKKIIGGGGGGGGAPSHLCLLFCKIVYKGGFPLIAEITRCHTFTKEINHASARCQYFNENFCCKNCLRVFSAMTGKPA